VESEKSDPERSLLNSALHTRYSALKWILQPVLLRQDFFTKEIRRLLHGGENWLQSPVLPRTRRAYETHLRPGSTAIS
jgi:hypothetical protein